MFNREEKDKSWGSDHAKFYREFLATRDEEKYVNSHLDNGNHRWYEIYHLQRNMDEYIKLLKTVSVSLRRRLLLNVAGTNFSRDKIMLEYGITEPRMLAFIENEYKHNTLELSKKSSLAVVARVPLTWQENNTVDDYWSYDHFRYIESNRWTWSQFVKYLSIEHKHHSIRGIIIKDEVIVNNNLKFPKFSN